ncbi:50S ribosomal protein L31 [bacterium]|jgi:large subunit ribosomal protein L31|nr:50S ribosomal protein L31 [bacterium]
MARVKVSKKKEQANNLSTNEIGYKTVSVSCACGAKFESGSTLDSIRVDICSNCHPFFTGENRILDSEGRVDKFRKKYSLAKK